ncbi:efflux RND transporter permease subunit, partial [Maribacter flavus]
VRERTQYAINGLLVLLGILAIVYGYWLGLILIAFAITSFLKMRGTLSKKRKNLLDIIISSVAIVVLLAEYWRPLGFDRSIVMNLIFVFIICFGLLGVFSIFRIYYERILRWALQNRYLFLIVPVTVLTLGIIIMRNTGKEFMPALNEGSFLLMPTSLPHAGVEENKRVLQQLDMAVASIPEIETVVGKAGRTESALDPAPLSMYENVIQYKSEYMRNSSGERQRYKFNEDGLFVLKNDKFIINPNNEIDEDANYDEASLKTTATRNDLIEDEDGEYYRNWRPDIESPDDIWNEIVRVTKLPGVTSAPKLQPIETRLVMLQTGMRAPMGIKVKGPDLKSIENFGLELEDILKQAEGVKEQAVFADRIVGKPYLLIDIKRDQLARYGVSIMDVQEILQVAVGGMPLTQTVEGRERYAVRVRYPRELRANPDDLRNIYVPVEKGSPVPLGELVEIRYEQGPQVIKSEDTFLIGY